MMKKVLEFLGILLAWAYRHFRINYILTPFGTLNIVYSLDNDQYVGYTDVFIFGIRIMRIMRTNPWNKRC